MSEKTDKIDTKLHEIREWMGANPLLALLIAFFILGWLNATTFKIGDIRR